METICAIATAYGKGAISIIRVSGDEAIKIVNDIFKGDNLTESPSHTIHYGHIVDQGNVIDEVLISIMRAPKTFTREDVVEINCHGGVYVTNQVLKLLVNHGANLALKGEFTKRAFLNGRIDLVEAEAVMDMISAEGREALLLANVGLSGRLSKHINELRSELLSLIASIEVNIDYPEYEDAIEMTNNIIKPKLEDMRRKLSGLLEEANKGKLIREGIKVGIIGRPNVGKSSLLNMLLNEQKAIVTDIAGTTRDTVEGDITLGGLFIKIIDTAGIRETNDVVEKIGVMRAKEVMEEADITILVLDSSEEITDMDQKLLDLTKDKSRIIVCNKNDLETKLTVSEEEIVWISTVTESGLEELENKMMEILRLNSVKEKDYNLLSNVRHITKVEKAYQAICSALLSIDDMMPVDMIEIDINEAWNSLGEIIGETASDSLLNELFSKFCLGK